MEFALEAINNATMEESNRVPKGYYFRHIYDFGTSGEHVLNLSELPLLTSAKSSNIKTNVKRIVNEITEKYPTFPTCKVARIDDSVLLVNVAVHAAKMAEAATNNNDDQ